LPVFKLPIFFCLDRTNTFEDNNIYSFIFFKAVNVTVTKTIRPNLACLVSLDSSRIQECEEGTPMKKRRVENSQAPSGHCADDLY